MEPQSQAARWMTQGAEGPALTLAWEAPSPWKGEAGLGTPCGWTTLLPAAPTLLSNPPWLLDPQERRAGAHCISLCCGLPRGEPGWWADAMGTLLVNYHLKRCPSGSN